MQDLLAYLNRLTPDAQRDYAKRCGTTVGYLRKAASVKQRLREALCIRLDRESSGAVRCEGLRDDVDWSYLAGRDAAVPPSLAHQAPAAIESVAGEVAHG